MTMPRKRGSCSEDGSPILVVIADATYREFIGRVLEELERPHSLAASSRDAIPSPHGATRGVRTVWTIANNRAETRVRRSREGPNTAQRGRPLYQKVYFNGIIRLYREVRYPSMEPLRLSKQVVRQFVLGRQGLWPGRRWAGREGTALALRAIEAVQIDPLNVVARSHDLVLASRVADYRPEHLDHLLYRERAFFDYGGTVFIYPMAELPYWRVIMARKAVEQRWAAVAATHALAIDEVRGALAERGPLSSRNFAGKSRLATYSYRATKDTGIALYYLWLTGEIMTHHRQGAERVYDLRQRLVPPARDVVAPVEEAEHHFARKEITFRGLARQRSWPGLLTGAFERPVARAEADAWLARLRATDEVIPVQVEGQTDLWFALAADRSILEELQDGQLPHAWHPVGVTTEEETTFLAPLDIVSARGRARLLFDLEYVWEVYKPAEARRWGYYTLPVLFGDCLVARLDPRLDRKTQTLVVNGLWLEDAAVSHGRAFTIALARGLAGFAHFLEAPDVDLGAVRPEALRRALERALT